MLIFNYSNLKIMNIVFKITWNKLEKIDFELIFAYFSNLTLLQGFAHFIIIII